MRQFSEKIALFIGLLLMICPFLLEYFDNREFNLLFVYTIIGAVLIILFLLKQKDSSVCLSPLDVIVCAIILYTCIRLSNQEVIDTMNVYTCCLLLVCYVLSKIVLTGQRDIRIILYAIVVSGILQAVLSILQWSNICITNHSSFDVTGSFANPGPLGGYISIALITAIGMLVLGKRNAKEKYFLYVSVILLGVVAFLSDSRSGCFSTVVTLFLICLVRTGWIKKTITGGLLLFLSVCLLISLYCYRPHSADARLFIWKVCGSMIQEKPVCGHGIVSFPEKYMLYQAKKLF